MSNSTLAPERHILFSSGAMSLAADQPTMRWFERGENKVLEVERAVFRSGTFRDSMGDQQTWGVEDLNLFVQHFNLLQSNGVMPRVPIRKGHRSFSGTANMDGLIGWVTGLRVERKKAAIDGNEYDVLYAKGEILDPIAQQKVSSGLWSNRSSEVGRYTDNNDVTYGPVFMGYAYVDFPAVERLDEFSKQPENANVSILMEEVMSNVQLPPKPSGGENGPALQAFSLGGKVSTDPVEIQSYINSLEADKTAAEAGKTAAEGQIAEFAAREAERVLAERDGFVDSLVTEKKILETGAPGLKEFARSLNPEQYTAWSAAQSGLPVHSLLEDHGNQSTGGQPGGAADTRDDAQKAFETAALVVKNLQMAGVKEDAIKAGPHFAACIAHDPQYTIGQ